MERSAPCGEEGVCLLYDPTRKCYYRTTLENIAMVTTKRMRKEMAALESKFDELSAKLKSEQASFISDIAKTNQAIIELVKGGTSK